MSLLLLFIKLAGKFVCFCFLMHICCIRMWSIYILAEWLKGALICVYFLHSKRKICMFLFRIFWFVAFDARNVLYDTSFIWFSHFFSCIFCCFVFNFFCKFFLFLNDGTFKFYCFIVSFLPFFEIISFKLY